MRLPGGGGYCSDTKSHNGYYNNQSYLSRPITASKPNLNSMCKKTLPNLAENHGSNLPNPSVIVCRERFDFYWHHGNKVGCGLRNMGNTCFLSSILQCLTHVPAWCNYLISEHHQKTCNDATNCIMCMLSRHVRNSIKIYHPINPEEIVNNLKQIGEHMVRGQQEDAHDFLLSLFNSLQKILCPQNLDIYSENTTALSRIFSGFLRSQVICSNCKKPSNTYEPFFNISLEIKGHTNIMSSLRKYTSSENMDDDNMFSCDNCKSRQTAEKRYTIHRAPNTLILQLKRYNQDSYSRIKLTHHVHFPDILDIESFLSSPPEKQDNNGIYKNSGVTNNDQSNNGQQCAGNVQYHCVNKAPSSNFNSNGTIHNSNMQFFSGNNNKSGFNAVINNYGQCSQTSSNYTQATINNGMQNNTFASNNCVQNSGNLYKLHGIVVHSGMNIGSGHYLAYVFNPISKQWFCMDDDKVEKVAWHQVRTAQAYLLFYIATKPLQKLPQIPQVPIFNRNNTNSSNKSSLVPSSLSDNKSLSISTNNSINISFNKTVSTISKNFNLNNTPMTNVNNSDISSNVSNSMNHLKTSPVRTSLPINQPRIIRPISSSIFRPILPVNGKPVFSIPAIKIHARLKPSLVKQPSMVENLMDIPLPLDNKNPINANINCANFEKCNPENLVDNKKNDLNIDIDNTLKNNQLNVNYSTSINQLIDSATYKTDNLHMTENINIGKNIDLNNSQIPHCKSNIKFVSNDGDLQINNSYSLNNSDNNIDIVTSIAITENNVAKITEDDHKVVLISNESNCVNEEETTGTLNMQVFNLDTPLIDKINIEEKIHNDKNVDSLLNECLDSKDIKIDNYSTNTEIDIKIPILSDDIKIISKNNQSNKVELKPLVNKNKILSELIRTPIKNVNESDQNKFHCKNIQFDSSNKNDNYIESPKSSVKYNNRLNSSKFRTKSNDQLQVHQGYAKNNDQLHVPLCNANKNNDQSKKSKLIIRHRSESVASSSSDEVMWIEEKVVYPLFDSTTPTLSCSEMTPKKRKANLSLIEEISSRKFYKLR